MKKEIEAKIKINSPEIIRQHLNDAKARFVQVVRQKDTFYDDREGRLRKNRSGLRLRRQSCDDKIRCFLTYKGPKETGPLKIRPEAEIEVSDAEALAMILESVGFSVRLVIEKQREIWQYMGCEIGLDEVALLGGFIEIEGPDEDAVHAVIASLNLSGNETITTGYAEMIHHVLKQQGTETRQALLDV